MIFTFNERQLPLIKGEIIVLMDLYGWQEEFFFSFLGPKICSNFKARSH